MFFREIYEIWRRDNSLARALDDLERMLAKTEEMFGNAVRMLREGGRGEPTNVHEEDRIVNEYQIELRRKVLKYLAVTGSTDLVSGLVLTSTVIDVERIGDYTKNIAELAQEHPSRLACGSFEERVRSLEKTVDKLFVELPPLLRSANVDEARALWDQCYWLRKGADEVLFELIRGSDTSLSRGESAAIALYVRYLKRIGAHLLNVLSSIINPFERIGYREESR